MEPKYIVMIVIAVVLLAAIIVLYILGKKAQKKQAEQDAQLQANKQYVSMFVIDKKKLKITESGLPQVVIDQTPKLLRFQKIPIAKVKVGPQIANMIVEDKIFDDLPLKKEIKAGISGLYLVDYKLIHGKQPVAAEKKKKKGFKAWVERLQEKAGATPIKKK